MTPIMRLRVGLAACAALAFLAACGGGDGGGQTRVIDAQAGDADAPACSACAPGAVTGLAAIGQPLAGARVTVYDDTGPLASAITGMDGRFRIDLPGPSSAKPLLLQLVTTVAGEPLVLHNLQSAEEALAGKRALHLTPLTELIAADVLGTAPQSALARHEISWQRVTRRALRDAEARVQSLVQPVLNATAVHDTVDLRSTAFDTDQAGLDAALSLIHVEPAQGGWQVAWRAGPASSRFFDPVSPAASALPASARPASDLQQELATTTVQLQSLLSALSAEYSGALPSSAELAAYLAPDFLHAGLDAAAYARVVLRRQDAPDDGGYSLVGARFSDVQLLQQPDADHAWVRFRVQARGVLGSRTESMRVIRDASGWRLQGNGAKASVKVRHAIVLGPLQATQDTLRSVHGAHCAGDVRAQLSGQWCSTPGGLAGLPGGGALEFGDPAEMAFGTLGVYRSAMGTLAEQRSAAAVHSRLVGSPSSTSRRYLVFEVDAREISPHVARVRVRGGALPSGGIDLVAPGDTVNGPAVEHWTLATDEDTGWAGLPWGWCPDDTEAADCMAAWSGMRSGSSLVFELLDTQGAVIGSETAVLPPEPPRHAADPGVSAFARFALAAQPASQPLIARVMADSGGAWIIDWPWRTASGVRWLRADLSLQRTDLASAGGAETLRRRVHIDPASHGRLAWTLPGRRGWGATWLHAQLTATDELGVQRIHFIAPSNPH